MSKMAAILYRLQCVNVADNVKSQGIWRNDSDLDCLCVWLISAWASYQICKIAGWTYAGKCRERFPSDRLQRKPLVRDHGMHHGMGVMHMPWCMSGSLTCGGGENIGTCNPQLYVSDKRPIEWINSLISGRCSCSLKLATFELISRIDILHVPGIQFTNAIFIIFFDGKFISLQFWLKFCCIFRKCYYNTAFVLYTKNCKFVVTSSLQFVWGQNEIIITFELWMKIFRVMGAGIHSTVEVWEWINNFIPHFTRHVITYPCWD